MIRLIKGPEPAWLCANKAVATNAYKDAPKDSKPSPWRAEEVVNALKEECRKKCMYCEGFIDDVSYSAVEHIRPKKHFEELVLEWTNLGLACSRCNTNKGEYWTEDDTLMLLNPYEDDVEKHIEFRGPLTVALLTSARGRNTVRKLKLNKRDDLLISRMKQIEALDSILRLWHDETNAELKDLYAEDVDNALSRDNEFTGPLRSYASGFGFRAQS